MDDEVKPIKPNIPLATQDWVLKEIMDTERRIEKAFHDQTMYLGERHNSIEKTVQDQMLYLGQKFDQQNQRFDQQHRWMIGIMVTIVAALITLVATAYFQ